MFLLFQRMVDNQYVWLFTGTFNSSNEAWKYAKEYFGQGTEFHICEQDKVSLSPRTVYVN